MAKVLIIDDNEKNIELFKDFVESWGYSTILAYQGQEAIELAKKEKPDAIILDVMLPGMSGYEVCSELKDNPLTRFIPIVMVTALPDMENRAHGFKLGTDNFLIKPVNYKELRAILGSLLRKKKWLETMENRVDVLKSFIMTVNILAPQYQIDTKSGKYACYNRLLRYLRVTEEVKEHILTTAVVRDLEKAVTAVSENKNDIFKIMTVLKLAEVTEPLMQYVEEYLTEVSQATKEKIDSLNLQQEADILVVVERFADLVSTENEDLDITLQRLKEMATQGNYSKEVMAGLEQTITDAHFAESLK